MSEVDVKNPVIQGRASIINCALSVRVLWREQLRRAIKWLIKHDYEFEWEIEHGDSHTPSTYVLTVYGIHWAKNLKDFSEVLVKCDYQFD